MRRGKNRDGFGSTCDPTSLPVTGLDDLLCLRELRLPDLRLRGGDSSTSTHSSEDLPCSLLSRLEPDSIRGVAENDFLDVPARSSEGLDIVNFGRTVGDVLSAVSGYENTRACISLDGSLCSTLRNGNNKVKQPLTMAPSAQ